MSADSCQILWNIKQQLRPSLQTNEILMLSIILYKYNTANNIDIQSSRLWVCCKTLPALVRGLLCQVHLHLILCPYRNTLTTMALPTGFHPHWQGYASRSHVRRCGLQMHMQGQSFTDFVCSKNVVISMLFDPRLKVPDEESSVQL
jgi:hypothetical protein